MQSKAITVLQYLAELPPEKRFTLEAVRKVILKNLDKGFQEGMQYGMIGYAVPHSIFPAGYHCDPKQPLPFAGLASQKNYFSVYLMCLYANSDDERDFRAKWEATGRKLDMGKCCIRFKKLEDVALDVLASAIRKVTAKRYIERYQASLQAMGRGPKKKNSSAAKSRKRIPKRTTTSNKVATAKKGTRD